jgi:hypothetical protein
MISVRRFLKTPYAWLSGKAMTAFNRRTVDLSEEMGFQRAVQSFGLGVGA